MRKRNHSPQVCIHVENMTFSEVHLPNFRMQSKPDVSERKERVESTSGCQVQWGGKCQRDKNGAYECYLRTLVGILLIIQND